MNRDDFKKLIKENLDLVQVQSQCNSEGLGDISICDFFSKENVQILIDAGEYLDPDGEEFQKKQFSRDDVSYLVNTIENMKKLIGEDDPEVLNYERAVMALLSRGSLDSLRESFSKFKIS